MKGIFKMNNITINLAKEEIVITKKFEKLAKQYGTKAYRQLCEVRKNFPEFQIVVRTIKTNPSKESYKGLNYDYMYWYIQKYENKLKRESALRELEHLIDISKCHSTRYSIIKEWFLGQYPDINKYWVKDEKGSLIKEIRENINEIIDNQKENEYAENCG